MNKINKTLLTLSLLLFTTFLNASQADDGTKGYASITLDKSEYTHRHPLFLNSAEKEYLRTRPLVKYVYDPDWRPFEWTDDLGEHTGIILNILQLIEERSLIDFIQVRTTNWAEAIQRVETGKASMFSAIGVTEARKSYLDFTDKPLFSTPYVLVSRHGEDYLDGLADANESRVATISTSTIESILREKRPDVDFSLVNTIKDGFDALRQEKIDVFVVNAASAKYYINILEYSDLKIAYKTDLTLDLRIAIRKDMPHELLSIIDKAMDTISEKEIGDIFYKWTEMTVKKEIDWVLLWKLLGGVTLIVLFLLWNTRRLKEMVQKQTSKINEQKRRLEDMISTYDRNVIASRTDLDGDLTYVSDAFCKISGYTEDELLGRSHNITRHPDTSDEIFNEIWETILSGRRWTGEIKNLKKDGGAYYVETIITPEYDLEGVLYGYSAIRQDITDKKKVERLSITDGLTNIFNRRHFNDLFPEIINSSNRSNDFICLIILDVDHFKLYNDTYGHQKGDDALIKIALSLTDALHRADDYCFRLGGEEFGIVFKSEDKASAIKFANGIRERVEALQIIHEKNSASDYVTASLGLVCQRAGEIQDVDVIYKAADDLLYQAKESGRNRVRV